MDNISASQPVHHTHKPTDQPAMDQHVQADKTSAFQADAQADSLISDSLLLGWQQAFGNIKHAYVKAADSLVDEIWVTLSQQQVNDALYKFVTKNVKMLHNLKLDIHEGWLRLSCTVDMMGIFATVASNFELVHLQLDRHTQRLVLRQISDTDII